MEKLLVIPNLLRTIYIIQPNHLDETKLTTYLRKMKVETLSNTVNGRHMSRALTDVLIAGCGTQLLGLLFENVPRLAQVVRAHAPAHVAHVQHLANEAQGRDSLFELRSKD